MTTQDPQAEKYMVDAIRLAMRNVRERKTWPFGAVLVREGVVLARAANGIHLDHDPTAHAELLAIRAAAVAMGTPRLDGAVMYASGHPCPMCLAAMHLCGIAEAWFAYSNEEGEPYGLSTLPVYADMARPPMLQQRLRLRLLRPADEAGLYAQWAQRRRVGATAASAGPAAAGAGP